ncbi:NAD(P)H-quinone oxidoreductase subunit I chloroplastic [Bienertia sinuspersici]
MVTGFINYGQQTIPRQVDHIGTFSWSIHFEFDKCIACEVCVRVCPIDLPVVDWKLETDIRKKRLLNYSIDSEFVYFVVIVLSIVQQIVYQ